MEDGKKIGIIETDIVVPNQEIQAPRMATLEPKPVRVPLDQQIRQALTRYDEANLDQASGNRNNGAVLGMTADEAWQALSSLREHRGGEEIYQSLIQAAVKKRG